MKKTKTTKLGKFFQHFSESVTKIAGKPVSFITACIIIVMWSITGPLFNYSDTWQLVINTGTTIITFLMVFVIQQTQNKDTLALHLKLNELIASTKGASNRLVDVEDLTEEELEVIKKFYIRLSKLAKTENIHQTHSLDEADQRHKFKLGKGVE